MDQNHILVTGVGSDGSRTTVRVETTREAFAKVEEFRAMGLKTELRPVIFHDSTRRWLND